MAYLEKYEEEKRVFLQDIVKHLENNITKLDAIAEKIKDPLTEMTVTGSVDVNNLNDEFKITNFDELKEEINELKNSFNKSISEIKLIVPDEVTIKNPIDSVTIKNLNALENKLDKVILALNNIDPQITVKASDINLPTSPTKAIAVRLSDGKSFYKSMFVAQAEARQEVDPFVGYQPTDRDTSSDPKYYGFVRKNGAWYIMREGVSAGTYRYAWGVPRENGGGLYPDAWTDRANLTYDYFYNAF